MIFFFFINSLYMNRADILASGDIKKMMLQFMTIHFKTETKSNERNY